MSLASTDEMGPLVARIVDALMPYDIPTGHSWSRDERMEPATAVLAVLGLERRCWDGDPLLVGDGRLREPAFDGPCTIEGHIHILVTAPARGDD